jgi:RNA polymerase sigma-70 factor, ECF subfamily
MQAIAEGSMDGSTPLRTEGQPHPHLDPLSDWRFRGGESSRFRRKSQVDDTDSDPRLRRVIAAARRGDEGALQYLYLRYKDNVYGYVCSIVRDEHDAEDVTQQVFMKLMRSICRYEPRGVPFSAWILRVARNVALDHLRAKRLVPVEEVRDPNAGEEEQGLPHHSPLRAALDELPEDQRRVLVMRHVVGLAPGEIAALEDRTEASVHGLHHRGRRALQRTLQEQGAAPTVAAAGA